MENLSTDLYFNDLTGLNLKGKCFRCPIKKCYFKFIGHLTCYCDFCKMSFCALCFEPFKVNTECYFHVLRHNLKKSEEYMKKYEINIVSITENGWLKLNSEDNFVKIQNYLKNSNLKKKLEIINMNFRSENFLYGSDLKNFNNLLNESIEKSTIELATQFIKNFNKKYKFNIIKVEQIFINIYSFEKNMTEHESYRSFYENINYDLNKIISLKTYVEFYVKINFPDLNRTAIYENTKNYFYDKQSNDFVSYFSTDIVYEIKHMLSVFEGIVNWGVKEGFFNKKNYSLGRINYDNISSFIVFKPIQIFENIYNFILLNFESEPKFIKFINTKINFKENFEFGFYVKEYVKNKNPNWIPEEFKIPGESCKIVNYPPILLDHVKNALLEWGYKQKIFY